MDQQGSGQQLQDHAAYLAGTHDFQGDIERLTGSDLVGTILETVILATGMRFSGVARVTADRWVACRTVDEVDFGLNSGDEIEIGSTFCQTVRDTSEMVIFGDVDTDPDYKHHPIAVAFGIVSYVSVPIFRGDGSFFGTLCAIDTVPKEVKTPRLLGMFKMFADLIGRTLETEERLEAQELLTEHDRRLAQIQEEFVAILGHDLRNPVAALQSGVRLLGKEPLSERGNLLLSLMRASLHRMHELVDNMMLHAKSRLGGGITISPQPNAPLGDALAHVVEEIRMAAPERQIELDLDLGTALACDPARVAQAVSNLVSNAVEHGAPESPVTVTARPVGEEITIAVANSGEAIPEESRRALFQPFRRGSDQDNSGLGLGLHIAAAIARAHGGGLGVDCDSGITTFTLTLPATPPA